MLLTEIFLKFLKVLRSFNQNANSFKSKFLIVETFKQIFSFFKINLMSLEEFFFRNNNKL